MNPYDYTDGIVGDVLFWSLRKCIGHEYDFTTHRAWVRIFSAMLKVRIMTPSDHLEAYHSSLTYTCTYITLIYIHIIQVIVPVALQYELRNGEAQIDRLRVAQEEKPTEVSRASVASTM